MTSKGIPYFPLECQLDDKFALIEAEFGLEGFAVIVKLFQKIFGQLGYYCEYNDEVKLLFGRSVGLDGDTVSDIVSAAVKRGIFDKELFEKYHILTSEDIQEKYFIAVSRRKKVDVNKRYLLARCDCLPKNADISEEIADISEQRKEKKSISKYSKEKEIAADSAVSSPSPSDNNIKKCYGEYANVFLSDEDLSKLQAEFPYDYMSRIERLSEYMASSGKSYKNHLATIRSWSGVSPRPPVMNYGGNTSVCGSENDNCNDNQKSNGRLCLQSPVADCGENSFICGSESNICNDNQKSNGVSPRPPVANCNGNNPICGSENYNCNDNQKSGGISSRSSAANYRAGTYYGGKYDCGKRSPSFDLNAFMEYAKTHTPTI